MTKQLYVWDDVLHDYTSGIIFAVADSLEAAMALVLSNEDLTSVRDAMGQPPKVFDLTEDVCRIVWGGG